MSGVKNRSGVYLRTAKHLLNMRLSRLGKKRGPRSKERKAGYDYGKICLFCGCNFYLRPLRSLSSWSLAKFCSKNCHYKSIIGRKLTEDHARKIRDSLKGKMPKNIDLLHYDKKIRAKVTEKITGEKNYAWIKDRELALAISKRRREERNDAAYFLWRRRVYRRDERKCRLENNDCWGKLVVHHILSWKDYPELRYDLNNGITLCKFHHPRKREKEKASRELFKSILSCQNSN